MSPLDPYRLPSSVLPTAYRLRMEPDLVGATFAGTAEIDVEVTSRTDVIVLNAIELELDAPVVRGADGATRTGTVALDEALERASLSFGGELSEGAYVLELGFTGRLNDELRGFYKSTFSGEDGTTHTIATTQFEATDARRAFPCFDEPSLKATFAVTLVVPDGLSAYSNSSVVAETALGDGRRAVSFATTMKMSTYLVAFVIGPFESTPAIDVDGVPLRVVYPPGKGHLTPFAIEVGAFSLRFFEEYFGVAYPGDKVDLVAIPDFAYGAMENLGCVTFREAALLADAATASQNELVRIAMVIAHELAHMWFGDLVTMSWWEGLWLNEAFATYMQYVCADAFRPDWKMWVRFSTERELGLKIDALHSTRSIEFPVRAPAEAMEMADPITYQKGGSVLKMLETYLSAPTFRDGIRRYLAEHAYANTVTGDLWAALEAVSGEPVGEIMDSWIHQGGHPIVRVEHGTLAQRPFQLAAPLGPSNIGGPWHVPVRSRALRDGTTARQLLGAEPAPLAAESPAVVNADGTGFYRTSYGAAELASIVAHLDALSEIERAVLLGDTWALARAEERTIADVLALASGLGTEVEPAAWEAVDQTLDFLDRVIPPGDEHRELLAARTRTLLSPIFSTLGWERTHGEDERAQVLRATLVRRLGTTGEDPGIRAEAAARFDGGVVEGDLADAIVAVVNSMRRPGDFDELLRRCKEAKDPLTEERYRQGLAGVADEALCLRLFETCFDEFRMQDAPIIVARLVANRIGGRAVWAAVTVAVGRLPRKGPPAHALRLRDRAGLPGRRHRLRRACRRVPPRAPAGGGPAARRPVARGPRLVRAARRSRAPHDARHPSLNRSAARGAAPRIPSSHGRISFARWHPRTPTASPRPSCPPAYRLRLEPDLAAATFVGAVEIDLDVLEATSTIVLNAVELELDAPVVKGSPGHQTGTVTLDEGLERATLAFPDELTPGRHVLSVGFRGTLNDQLRGFYRSTFTDDAGATHTIATTQFESTDARRAFPCFDEPAFKATYTVTLAVPAGLSAYSNSPVAFETPRPDGGREVSFAPTMKMSTYLVAFVIGPFEQTRAIDVDGVPLRGRLPPGQGPPHRLRPRDRRVLAAVLLGLLRHRLPGRQGRPRRDPRLRRRRDGEPRVHHVPGDRAAGRPCRRPPSSRSSASPRSSPTSSPTCGSATSSPCSGGKASG